MFAGKSGNAPKTWRNIKKSEKTLDIWYHSCTQVPCEYLSAADMQRIPNCNKGSPCRMVCNQAKSRILQRPCILAQWHTDSKKAPHWPDQVGPWALHVDNLPWHMEEVSLSHQAATKRSKAMHVFPCRPAWGALEVLATFLPWHMLPRMQEVSQMKLDVSQCIHCVFNYYCLINVCQF